MDIPENQQQTGGPILDSKRLADEPHPYKRVEHIGDATLYLGDCLDILPTLDKVDAVITDPPYGIGAWSTSGGYKNRISIQDKKDLKRWDILPKRAIAYVWEMDCEIIAWGGNYLAEVVGGCRSPLVWNKYNSGMQYAEGEIAWTNFERGTLRILNFPVMNGDQCGKKEHPTQKPTKVMEWSIKQLKDQPEIILDPFMGSGTTGVACMNLGRKFIGIEIEEKYFDIACQRIREAYKQPRLFDETVQEVQSEQAKIEF